MTLVGLRPHMGWREGPKAVPLSFGSFGVVATGSGSVGVYLVVKDTGLFHPVSSDTS